MIATVLYRHAGSPDVSGLKNPFDDVPEGQWFTNAVKWAAANGIVIGRGNGKYGPDEDIARQDLSVILSRYADFAGIKLSAAREYPDFKDGSDIADYAKEAIEKFSRSNIINGKPGNLFDPKGEATRAEVAAMLNRLLVAAEME